MNSLHPDPFLSKAQFSGFIVGVLFLLCYWLFGFDGITFSDDVYYLMAGKKFWEGTMEVNDYHFSSRWGAYVPSGFIGYLLGFEPHKISLISLLSYSLSLFILIKTLPKSAPAWVLVLWFCTQVYLLHFLTKVYPDSLLVLWTCLVPVAASYRKSMPILAGILLVLSLFIGFLTKETIVLLAPLPFLLFYFDWKSKSLNIQFYISLVLAGIAFAAIYLGYFWIKFGDPLHRISSINAGHYISEFTYADKGIWSILKRLTILPVITFVERSYWAWIVFAIPGIAVGFKSKKTPAFEFTLACVCLVVGFWFMTSTLDFYNPIYLNPRHLIILVPILSMIIALGWKKWKNSGTWKIYLIGLLLLGVVISLIQMDLKMAAFHLALAVGVRFANFKFYPVFIVLILVVPAVIAISYQKKLKQYPTLVSALQKEVQSSDNQTLLVTNNFLEFSDNVLYPYDLEAQEKLHGLDYLLDNNLKADRIKLLIYAYYQHAYPQEKEEIELAISRLKKSGFELTEDNNEGLIWKQVYVRNPN